MSKDIKYINSQFVTRKQAEQLRKLGFNEPCVGFFSDVAKTSKNVILVNTKPIRNKDARKKLTAPMYQQAISFLLAKLEDKYKEETGHAIFHLMYFKDGSGRLLDFNDRYKGNFGNHDQLIDLMMKTLKKSEPTYNWKIMKLVRKKGLGKFNVYTELKKKK